MASKLDWLRGVTNIGADYADFAALRRFAPTNCTVTPKLVLDLAQKSEAADLVEEAMVWGRSRHGVTSRVADRLIVNIGVEMARIVSGRVSAEVDADLAFDPEGTVEKARVMVADFEHRGVERERILVGLAATWEGIVAAETLRYDGIGCDLTLVYSLAQAAAAAEAGASVVSPPVSAGDRLPPEAGVSNSTAGAEDGEVTVRRIVDYYGTHAIGTVVNAASFESPEQIERLASIADVSLSPHWLELLAGAESRLPADPAADIEAGVVAGRMALDEKSFRFVLNEDGRAAEQLARGIRNAVARLRSLRNFASRRLENAFDPLAAPLSEPLG